MLKKIRVTCNDPDKTDSSSDDDDETPLINITRPRKRFIKEILFPHSDTMKQRSRDHQSWDRISTDGSDHVIRGSKKRTGVPRGVSKEKYGKWRARYWDWKKKRQVHLGTFRSAEEAATAYEKNRLRLQLEHQRIMDWRNRAKRRSARAGVVVTGGSDCVDRGHDGRCVVGGSDGTALGMKKQQQRGVSLRKSGKWCAQIKVPANLSNLYKKKNLWLGTFETFEVAADALNKKSLEIDLLLRRLSAGSSDVSVTEDASKASESDFMVVDAPKGLEVDQHKHEVIGLDVDVSTVVKEASDAMIVETVKGFDHVNGNESEGSDANIGSQGSQEGSDGSDQPWPIYMEVVDMYGRLLPEYRWLDEELWFCKPGEEEETNTATAAVGCHSECDWYYQSRYESKPC